jgi:hypothetical protein
MPQCAQRSVARWAQAARIALVKNSRLDGVGIDHALVLRPGVGVVKIAIGVTR